MYPRLNLSLTLKIILFQPLVPIQALFEHERHIAQREQDGYFDQGADGRCQRLVGIDPVDGDAHGDGQLEAAGVANTKVD